MSLLHPLKTEKFLKKMIYVYKYFTYLAEIDYTRICLDIFVQSTASRRTRINRRRGAGKKVNMNVNGVTSTQAAYGSYTATTKESTATEAAKSTSTTQDSGVVYEHSAETTSSAKKTYTPNTNLINQLKADAEARTSQLRSLVEKMMTQQSTAYGQANDIWQFLRNGDYKVDPATKLQAQKDIAEDGYWGVKQTSDRILSFATALTGGDPDKIDEMKAAFEKGYKKAEQTWGGQLPDICQQTYDAVLSGFDKMAEDAGK